jgi:hypothetical protein
LLQNITNSAESYNKWSLQKKQKYLCFH